MANKEARKALEEAQEKRSSLLNNLLKTVKPEHIAQRQPKKKTNVQLYGLMRLGTHANHEVRSLESYISKSYNLEKQKLGLVKHLYVKYSVPNFMYDLFTDTNKNHPYFGYQWFFCLTQGGSFQKLVKDILTKKECISFLETPDGYNFQRAFWFAKLKNQAISPKIISSLLFTKDFFSRAEPTATNVECYAHVIEFYAKYHTEMDDLTFDEVTDFIYYKIGNDAAFTLRGRTLNSIKMLSNEWHNLMQKAKYGSKVTWDGKLLAPWYYENKEAMWEIFELKSNHDLIKEGRKQKHCVSYYVTQCVEGRCNIFSLRKHNPDTLVENEKSRITMEMRQSSIVQIRGSQNRQANGEEIRIIQKFADKQGFQITSRSW